MRPGAGRITIVHDPYHDAETTHTALAANNPAAGTVAVHPTVGTASPSILALNVISALGYQGIGPLTALHLTRNAEHAFAAAAAWLVADDIGVVVVPQAQLLSDPARTWLAGLATAAQVRVVPIWHGHRPRTWNEAFPGHPEHLLTEAESLQPILAGTRHRHRTAPPPDTAPPPPPLHRIPAVGMAGFRAQARRQLTATEFDTLDAYYRHGMRTACRWITGHRLRPSPILRGQAAAHQRCDSATGLGWPAPEPFADTGDLQAFVCALALEAPSPAAAVARVRGAQAALLLHGMLLAVPANLTATCGPGLSGIPFRTQTAAAIRAGIANPALAAAVAVVAFTGRAPERLGTISGQEHNRASRTVINLAAPQQSRLDMYTVPPTAAPLLRAAAHYQRLTARRSHDLAFGIDSTSIAQASERRAARRDPLRPRRPAALAPPILLLARRGAPAPPLRREPDRPRHGVPVTIRVRTDVIFRRLAAAGISLQTFAATTGVDLLTLTVADHEATTLGFLSRAADLLRLPIGDLLAETAAVSDHDARLVEAAIAAHPGSDVSEILDVLAWGTQRRQLMETTQAVLRRDGLHRIVADPHGALFLAPPDDWASDDGDYEHWFEERVAPGVLDAGSVLEALHAHAKDRLRAVYCDAATAARLSGIGLLACTCPHPKASANPPPAGSGALMALHPDLLFALGLAAGPDSPTDDIEHRNCGASGADPALSQE